MKQFRKGLVSIVIPTYFSEKYLEKCLQSVVVQTYTDIEVIIVDGESTDGTKEIIRKFEKKYSFVHMFEKKNEGVSISRNYGMEQAKGEFLQFVDSDDFLLPNATETMVREAIKEQVDVVVAGFRILKTGEERRPERFRCDDAYDLSDKFKIYYHYKNNCINVPWNKIYRRESIRVLFKEDLSLGEDLLFNLNFFNRAAGILFIPDVIYEYNNVDDQSLAYRYREDGFEIETFLHDVVMNFILNHNAEYDSTLYQNYMFGVKTKFAALVRKSGLSRKECLQKIQSWLEEESLQELALSKGPWNNKDKIFLWMITNKLKRSLYWYYRIMA